MARKKTSPMENQMVFPLSDVVLDNKELPMVLNKQFKVVMSNTFALTAQRLSNYAYKFSRLMIMQIRPGDTRFLTYRTNMADLARLFGIKDATSLYRKFSEVSSELMNWKMHLESDPSEKSPTPKKKNFIDINVFSFCSYANGTVIARLNPDLAPYLMELKKYYLQFPINDILTLSSTYPGRLLELIFATTTEKLDEDHPHTVIQTREISIEDLRNHFVMDYINEDTGEWVHEYTTMPTLRKFVDRSCKEMTEKSAYTLNFQTVKVGRTVVAFTFKLQYTANKIKSKEQMTITELKKLVDFGCMPAPDEKDIKEMMQSGVLQSTMTKKEEKMLDSFLLKE